MTLTIAAWTQKTLASDPAQFTRNSPVEVEPPVQFFGAATIRTPHTNPAGSSSRSLLTVLFEDESGAVVDNAHPRAGEIPWSWTTGVGGGRWFSYITTDVTVRAITVPQGLRLSLVGLYGWDDSSTARPVESLTVEGGVLAGAQVARYARDDGSLATVGEARVWDDGRWKTVYESWKPRTVAIRSTTARTWNTGTDSGDTDLIASLRTTGISFVEDTVCDWGVPGYTAGNRIPAGTSVRPNTTAIRTYTFTSVQ